MRISHMSDKSHVQMQNLKVKNEKLIVKIRK